METSLPKLRTWLPYIAGITLAAFAAVASPKRMEAAAGYAWPAAAVIIAYLLRSPLGELLTRLIEIKWGDKSARFEQSGREVPEAATTARTVEPTLPPPSFQSMGSHEKKILATLWHYQRLHFPDNSDDRRWTFLVLPPSDYWMDYFIGGGELLRRGLIGTIRPDRRIFLTSTGLDFCKANSNELAKEDRIVFPDG